MHVDQWTFAMETLALFGRIELQARDALRYSPYHQDSTKCHHGYAYHR